jgi:LysM repeat protein
VSGNSYCIEQNWGVPLPSSSSASPTSTIKPTPTNGITTPTPVQQGITDTCDRFYQVKTDDGCFDIAANNSISIEQFYTWNPAVNGCGGNLWPTYYVCVGVIGFTPTPKPISATTTTKTAPTNGITTPTPIQSPFVTSCNKFYQVKTDDGCEAIAIANGISFDNFYIVGFTPSAKPSTTANPTPTNISPTNGIATPSPTQSGMVSNCDAFYKVVKDDGCEAIAHTSGITPAQFYAWNPYIGTNCKNLWPDYYVCVSIVGVNPSMTTSIKPTTTKSGNGITTPTPIQNGMTGSCKKFYKIVTGDGCWGIANANKVSQDDFLKWNPAVKSDCSGLFPNYYVCVGV